MKRIYCDRCDKEITGANYRTGTSKGDACSIECARALE